MRVRSSLVLVSLVVAAVAGCSTKEDGQATPTGTAPPKTSNAEPTKARPKVVDLKGVEPCKSLTASQQADLKIDKAKNLPLDVVKTGNEAPTCSYDGDTATLFSYNISLVTDKGVDYWTEGGNLDVTPVDILGFGAKQVKLSGTTKGDCSVAVDVADGQQLFVQFLPIGDGFSQAQMCDNAKKGAELSLATIQTLK